MSNPDEAPGSGVPEAQRPRRRAFLDGRGRIPVAGEDRPVLFPRALERSLERLADENDESPTRLGVLLHGPARVGKSSLAAQVVRRLDGVRTAALRGAFDDLALLDAVVHALGEEEARERLDRFRGSPPQPDEKEDLLVGFFDRFTDPGRPLLVVVDHLDAVLRANDSPPRRLKDEASEPLTLLFRSAERTRGRVRLVVTSRSMFTLPDRGRDLTDGLLPVELGLPDPGRAEALVAEALPAGSPAGLEERVFKGSLGHPGLVDLLTRTASAAPKALEGALGTLETYLGGRGGNLPPADLPEVAAFFESLLFERLLQDLDISERDLWRLSTSFEVPVPLAVVEEFARRFDLVDDASPGGLEGSRLAALGLWDFFEAPESEGAGRVHVVPNPAALRWAGALDDEERPAVAMHLLQLFVDAWLPASTTEPNDDQSLQLCRSSVAAGDPQLVPRTLPGALRELERRQRPEAASKLGRQALQLVESSRVEPTSTMLTALADLLYRQGQVGEAGRLLAEAAERTDRDATADAGFRRLSGLVDAALGKLGKAVEHLDRAVAGFERAGLLWDAAAALHAKADVLVARGELEEAVAVRRQELETVEALGEARRRISVLGHLASLLSALDRHDEAAAKHETALEGAEALGDPHLVAAARGELARTVAQAGEIDRALELHRRRLEFFEEAGDLAGKSHGLWSLARLELQRSRIDAAMELLVEAYRINLELDRPEGIGVVGLDYGQVLWAAGMMGEARLILDRSVESFRRLGDLGLLRQAESIREELTSPS